MDITGKPLLMCLKALMIRRCPVYSVKDSSPKHFVCAHLNPAEKTFVQQCTPPSEWLLSVSAQSSQTPLEHPLSQDISVPCHSGDLCNSHTTGNPVSLVKYTGLLLSNFLTGHPGQEPCAHLLNTLEIQFVPFRLVVSTV